MTAIDRALARVEVRVHAHTHDIETGDGRDMVIERTDEPEAAPPPPPPPAR